MTLPVSAGPMLLMDCNLFWFFGYPEVHILILPSFDIVSQNSLYLTGSKEAFGSLGMIYAILRIALIGSVV